MYRTVPVYYNICDVLLILIDFAPDVVIIYCNVGTDRVKNVLKIEKQKKKNELHEIRPPRTFIKIQRDHVYRTVMKNDRINNNIVINYNVFTPPRDNISH